MDPTGTSCCCAANKCPPGGCKCGSGQDCCKNCKSSCGCQKANNNCGCQSCDCGDGTKCGSCSCCKH
ncbi:hypothetical protein RvY_19305 [Ramazzottius varieornatus]|uniref:Metallothionein n=1 Tax=Ramazzottius varieornatus TaxID=947166 RepID=A0A1D1WC77_RAMVA|nr:hypothetical protein RvY_19305 [Ramazzottius varieornatus]